MDAYDLFKKLSYGAKFTRRKLDSIQKSKQETSSVVNVNAVKEEVSVKPEPSISNHEDMKKSEVTELTLLGSMTTEGGILGNKSKKKKKKIDPEVKAAILEQERLTQLRKKHRITVVGKDVPEPVEAFEQLKDYGISPELIQRLHECNYAVPTPIQMQAIPLMLQGRQILACAPTGSGKTVAFLLPIIHHLKGPRRKGFRAVIVSPTRELAKQTYRECLRLADCYKLKVHIISKVATAINKFGPDSSQKFDILITTPNRLVYLLNQEPPVISLSNVEWLVVDESDKLFEAGERGFRDQLAVIYQACNADNIRRAMFSATYTPVVAKWARKNLKKLVSITIGHRNAAAELVEQELLFVGSEQGKLVAFRNLIKQGLTPPVLVFVQTKERAKELFKELIYDGINVDIIHADRTQMQRDNVVRSFREGFIWVLICTELMGRGIDFKGVNLVINYDFPPTAISYVHRIGRTGRAGRPGKAITFFTEDDKVCLRSIVHVMRDSGCDVPEYLIKLKKSNKRARKQFAERAPKRDPIFKQPNFIKSDQFETRKRHRKNWNKVEVSNGTGEPVKKKTKQSCSKDV
ncbi:ATP-dependent RNA helicase abstrakt [Gryllus bimaculatus]|nr:ATP-dependent RNA helicase abstrakt [Gryllus bimaculatus]